MEIEFVYASRVYGIVVVKSSLTLAIVVTATVKMDVDYDDQLREFETGMFRVE